MTKRASIHIRINRLRLPHLPPGGEAHLRDEIHRELSRLLNADHSRQSLQSQASVTIPCPAQHGSADPRFIARQIAAAIRQSGRQN